MGLFPGGVAPASITLDVVLAEPAVRKAAGVTSAVVAAANVAVATATAEPIAAPAEVAAVAATVGKAVTRKAHKAKVA